MQPIDRAEAQVLGQNLFALGPNVYTQFLYFVSVVAKYAMLKGEQEPTAADPYACGCGEPSADDWADADGGSHASATASDAMPHSVARTSLGFRALFMSPPMTPPASPGVE